MLNYPNIPTREQNELEDIFEDEKKNIRAENLLKKNIKALHK